MGAVAERSKIRLMSRKHNELGKDFSPPVNKAASQLADAMQREHVTKGEMAERLKTSRAQVNRLLNPKHNPSLSSLGRAAAIVGRRLRIELI